MHVVLLGDSILDNGAYAGGGPAVVDHLRERIGEEGTASLIAVDGSMIEDMSDQLKRVPEDATYLVVSIGGNDAIMQADILMRPAESVWDALTQLSVVVDVFEGQYRGCLASLVELDVPMATCTIYNGAFGVASGEQRVVSAALRVFNDAIIQASLDVGCPIIDLRRVCNDRSDYANPIEPNAQGGEKIADTVFRLVSSPETTESVIVPSGQRMRPYRGSSSEVI